MPMPMPMPARSTINNARVFQAFLEGWLVRQETFLHELLSAQESLTDSHENEIRGLIARVLAHYQEYFDEKSRMANRNAFLVLSPTWFTPLEKAFFWIAGFKPCLALQLAMSSVNDLSQDQSQRLESLKNETKAEEKLLVDDFATIQESVASPPLADQARQDAARGQAVDGEVREVDTILETLKSAMENMIAQADMLRTTTAQKVVEILNPLQTVRFLAAAAQLQLRIRSLGIQKEAERIQHAPPPATAAAPTNGW